MGAPGQRPIHPVGLSPARPPGSVRRTTSIDISLGDGGTIVIVGRARDLVTSPGAGPAVSGAAEVHAVVGADNSLTRLETSPEAGDAHALVGAGVAGGFRARAAECFPAEAATPLGLLIDDLPIATLLAGYIRLREAARPGSTTEFVVGPEGASRMADLCSGWRTGGTLLSSMAAGHGIPLQDCPPAPPLVDPYDPSGWHAMEPIGAGTMRRVRRIDVVPRGDDRGDGGDGTAGELAVDAMFRDSYGEPDGAEVVLHEYGVRATFDPVQYRVTSIEADPHVLPFSECPAAAASAGLLVGRGALELPTVVRDELVGTVGCTHLNDLLRSLAGVPALVAGSS